jgi:hypothetical protein
MKRLVERECWRCDEAAGGCARASGDGRGGCGRAPADAVLTALDASAFLLFSPSVETSVHFLVTEVSPTLFSPLYPCCCTRSDPYSR